MTKEDERRANDVMVKAFASSNSALEELASALVKVSLRTNALGKLFSDKFKTLNLEVKDD